MENRKIINLLNKSDTNSRHFATKTWYVINDLNNAAYGVDQYGNNELDNIKYETKVLKPNLCDYADAYILVTGIIRTTKFEQIGQQNKGFQRSIYWNEYLIKETNQNAHANVKKHLILIHLFKVLIGYSGYS